MSNNRKDFVLTKLAEKVHYYIFTQICIHRKLYKNSITADVY